MFSGIVEEMGRVEAVAQSVGGLRLTVGCTIARQGTSIGDSIAVDGVCLTVESMAPAALSFHIQPVTARLTTLGALQPGSRVNLERAVAVGQRIGGHYVQGHIDAPGTIASRHADGAAMIVHITAPEEVHRYLVERGFIAVNGISLTVMSVADSGFAVSLVYHTQQSVNLTDLAPGSRVNLEVDVLAKYVERLVAPHRRDEVSLESLARAGFLETTE